MSAAPHQVIVRGGRDRFRTEVTARHHVLQADEPVDLGGTDLGPTPYEYLAAALGSCTVITLRMYADRKEWPLDGVEVEVRHEKIHARDCDCQTEATGRIDLITRRIRFLGDLDTAQVTRLLEIADRCPVHRTLTGEMVVKTTLSD